MAELEEKRIMSTEDKPSLPHVDFLSILKRASREEEIWEAVKNLSLETYKKHEAVGLLIVLGAFDRDEGKVIGMKQVKTGSNPIDSLLWVTNKDFPEKLRKWSMPPFDGAVIINHSGQVIGANIMLILTDYEVDVSDECGTRHIAAASFSKRNEVVATFTISEETYKARKFKDGREELVFDPAVETKKSKEKKNED